MEQTFSTEDWFTWKMRDINKYRMESASYDRFIKPKLSDYCIVNTMRIRDGSDWKTIYSRTSPILLFNFSEERVCFDKEAQSYSECAEEVDSYLEDFRSESGGDMRQ